jgi:hypothetical protein
VGRAVLRRGAARPAALDGRRPCLHCGHCPPRARVPMSAAPPPVAFVRSALMVWASSRLAALGEPKNSTTNTAGIHISSWNWWWQLLESTCGYRGSLLIVGPPEVICKFLNYIFFVVAAFIWFNRAIIRINMPQEATWTPHMVPWEWDQGRIFFFIPYFFSK